MNPGDTYTEEIRWFDDRDPELTFKAESMEQLKLEGDDGHIYRVNTWDGKVICNTDDKAGSHRGNIVTLG